MKSLAELKKRNEEELERKYRERLPIKFQESELKNYKIDSKKLIGQGVSTQQAAKATAAKEAKPPVARIEVRRVAKRQMKKPTKPKKKVLSSREMKFDDSLNEDSQRSFGQRLPSLKSHETTDTYERRMRKKDSSEKKSKKLGPTGELEESDEDEIFEDVQKANLLEYRLAQLKRMGSSQQEFEEPKVENIEVASIPPATKPNRVIRSYGKKSNLEDVKSDRIIASIDPLEDEFELDMNFNGKKSNMSRSSQRDTSTQMSVPLSHLDPNFPTIWNPLTGQVKRVKKPKKKPVVYTQTEIKQINKLFSFYYATDGPRFKRINSANYQLIHEVKEEEEEEEKLDAKKEVQKTVDLKVTEETKKDGEIVKIDEIKKIESSNQIVFQNFDKWLENYANKREKRNERVKSAQLKRENLFDQSLRKWSASIDKKSKVKSNVDMESASTEKFISHSFKLSDISLDKNKLINREIKSASILMKGKAKKNRPKSVTFNDTNKSKSESATKDSESVKSTQVEKDDDIKEQEPYLISAIEMEEILEEAASRAYSAKTVSSLTRVPSAYTRHLKLLQAKTTARKHSFDSQIFMESTEQIYTTSGSDSSDFENDLDDEDVDVDEYLQYRNARRVLRESSNLSASSIRRYSPRSLQHSDMQNRARQSSAKSQRIKSSTVDYRTKDKIKQLKERFEFESVSSYR